MPPGGLRVSLDKRGVLCFNISMLAPGENIIARSKGSASNRHLPATALPRFLVNFATAIVLPAMACAAILAVALRLIDFFFPPPLR